MIYNNHPQLFDYTKYLKNTPYKLTSINKVNKNKSKGCVKGIKHYKVDLIFITIFISFFVYMFLVRTKHKSHKKINNLKHELNMIKDLNYTYFK